MCVDGEGHLTRLPCFNDMEPKDLPADLLLVVRARKYLDYQQRMIEHIYDDVPPPTDRSIRSYKAFEAWIDWAKDYKEKQCKEDTKHSFGTEAENKTIAGFAYAQEWDYWEGMVWTDPISRRIVKEEELR